MKKLSRPSDTTFIVPGKDDPRAFIVARFIEWGACWTWEIQYHLTSDPWYIQRFVTDTSVYAPVEHSTLDLRGE